MIRRIVFVTGTRADFGKIKSLIEALLQETERFEVHIFATGMHMEPKYGYTVEEISKCGFDSVYRFINQSAQGIMDRSLASTMLGFGDYVRLIEPDLIVVHGDRVEALAAALVGSINNILVAHIEGGEVSGTIDETLRHCVSKSSHLHFVSNESAKTRLIQLGEQPAAIYVIGSPDIDIMSSPSLPSLAQAKAHYGIDFARYAIALFHPVTTSPHTLRCDTQQLIAAMLECGQRFIVVYPNSDSGSDIILEEYSRLLSGHPHMRLFPSIRFEYMLALLRHADFVLGNSSMGIKEAPYYGVPSINVGNRQTGRSRSDSIIHTDADAVQILVAITRAQTRRPQPSAEFGDGGSHQRFKEALLCDALWDTNVQKRFVDLPAAPDGP